MHVDYILLAHRKTYRLKGIWELINHWSATVLLEYLSLKLKSTAHDIAYGSRYMDQDTIKIMTTSYLSYHTEVTLLCQICLYVLCTATYALIQYVEPLLKDTLNKGHLSIKDKLCGPYRTMDIILPLKEDNLSITVKLAGPKCPLFRSFTV